MKRAIFLLAVILVLLVIDKPLSKHYLSLLQVSASDNNVSISDAVKPPRSKPVFPEKPPNDPLYPFQWNLDNIGEEYIGIGGYNKFVSNFGMQVEKAWKAGATGEGVKIAILSTGVAYENWTDPLTGYAYKKAPDFAETKFDTENARDFTVVPKNLDDPNDKFYHANDDLGGGTGDATLIAATPNNSIEFAGIAYKATILPIKIAYHDKYKAYKPIDYTIKGIYWAADHGADVIWASSFPSFKDERLHAAVKYAVLEKGVVFVTDPFYSNKYHSSGMIPGGEVWPAAYKECIAVGGTNYDGTLAYYVNYGKYVKLYAPHGNYTGIDKNQDNWKENIYYISFYPWRVQSRQSQYCFNQDFEVTMCPNVAPPSLEVAAVAAFIIQKHPDWTPEQVRTALLKSARKIGKDPLGGDILLVDAYAAYIYHP